MDKYINENIPKEAYRQLPVLDNLKVGEAKAQISAKKVIGIEEISKAYGLLNKYRDGKALLDKRITEEEEWWKIRHWDYLRQHKNPKDTAQPTSAWTFNAIMNKHADAMDNFPEPTCLPREASDEQSAKMLTDILPVILEYGDFEKVYSDNAWYKIKHGISCFGVLWDSSAENGLGEIKVSDVDVLNLFWEPGIRNIQDSENVFLISLKSTEQLKAEYPECADKLGAGDIALTAKYVSEENVDTSDKSVVIDWYYRKKGDDGKTILHYCKFSGNAVLFATENEPEYESVGLYEHGKYPFVLDVLFPEAGTCYGFGVIAVTKDPQLYIDRLDANILDYTMIASKPRYLARKDCGINKEEFLDLHNALVEVEGDINEERFKPLTVGQMDTIAYNVKLGKVDELKETIGNRDVNSGGTSGGATSGAAIATLQEAGNKVSRDMNAGSYRCFKSICEMMIELIRQFYTEPRAFRIIGERAGYEYIQASNSGMVEQSIPGTEMFRKPVFDIAVSAQRKNPFSTLSLNETAANLYNMGVFNPENAQMAEIMLEMMEFEGKDKVLERVRQGQTLSNLLMQMQQQMGILQQQLTATQNSPASSMEATGAASPGEEMVMNANVSAAQGVTARDIEMMRGNLG